MMNKNDLMGKRVCVSKKFVRRYHGSHRKWHEEETPVFCGWVVGFRTIQNGYKEYEFGEYGETIGGAYWVAEEYVQCVLICTNPHENPVKVPVSEVENAVTKRRNVEASIWSE